MALPLGSSIETQITDGPTLVSQMNNNVQAIQSVVQDVPQIQTVLTDNVANVSSIINAPFVEVTSVNGMTGDVITEPIMENFQANHYYLKNTIINYNGQIYWAKNNFTSSSSFNVSDWNAVSVSTAWASITGKPTKVSYWTNDGDGESPYATRLYVQSRDENLVTNGSGLLGNNYNFPQFTYDGTMTNGSPASFKTTTLNSTLYCSELIPVDVSSKYEFSFDVRTTNGSGRFYDCILSSDIDKNPIYARNCDWMRGTTTTLSQALNPGDTVIHLTSAANWDTSVSYSYQKGVIIWNYVNSLGYAYPVETYSRNVYPNLYSDNSAVDKNNNTITLTTGWAGPVIPAGTSLSQCTDGGTYIYIGSQNYTVAANTWVHRADILNSGDSGVSGFRAGTAFVQIGWLANRGITGSVSTWFTNIKFREYSNVDWNASSGKARILNKPTLSTVATSGSYNDLSNKPTIGNATLTIQKNGTNVQTFTANATSNKTANITVPVVTASTTDIGEGASLTTGDLYCVYDA